MLSRNKNKNQYTVIIFHRVSSHNLAIDVGTPHHDAIAHELHLQTIVRNMILTGYPIFLPWCQTKLSYLETGIKKNIFYKNYIKHYFLLFFILIWQNLWQTVKVYCKLGPLNITKKTPVSAYSTPEQCWV